MNYLIELFFRHKRTFFFPSIHLSNTQGHGWDTAQLPQGEGGLHPEQAPSFTTKRQTAIHAHI